MSDEQKVAVGELRVFLFSFHEHDGSDEEIEDGNADQAFFQMLASQPWELYEQQGPKTAEAYSGTTTVEALMAEARASLVEFNRQPEELVQIPIDKLRSLMTEGGWEFVGGMYCEFEGNHNDTEFYAVLRKT